MIRLILLIDFTETYATELLRGILDYSQSHEPWVICRMPPSYRVEHGIEGVLQWARQWKADAIIGQFNSNDDVSVFAEYGIIALAQDFIQRFQNIPNITGDYIGQGNLAAEFFIKKGFRNFAFYGYANAVWSQERCKGFSDTIKSFGYHSPSIYIKQSLEYLWYYDLEPLVEWLSKLPSSTAILACDDTRASVILEVCRLLRIKVPSEIAVLRPLQNLTHSLSFLFLSTIGSPAVYIFDF